MIDERAFNLRRREAMAADVHYVVDPAHEPVVPLGVTPRAVARKIEMRKLLPVGLHVALVVTPDTPQHSGPGARQYGVPAAAERYRLAAFVDDVRRDAGQRVRRTPRKQRRHTRQG